MELLYNEDSYMTEFLAETVSIEPAELNGKKVWDVILNRSCFFPEEGGQDSDTGSIFDVDNESEYKVIHVAIKDNILHHYVESEERPVLNRAHGCIKWDERYDKMQQHSGEHLVSGTVNRYFGFNNVGFHLGNDVTLDFDGVFTEENIKLIETTVNRAIFENFESKVYFPSPAQLKDLNYRSKKEIKGDVRIVEYPGYDICACCAPHVKRTGEIGLIKIVSAEHFKGGTRMMIKCGWRALNDYNLKFEACRSISQLLSSKQDEVYEAVDKLSKDYLKAKYTIGRLQADLLDCLEVNALSMKNPVIFIDAADVNVARENVNDMVGRSDGYCGCFIGDDERGYSYIVGTRSGNCQELLAQMKEKLQAKGGGKPAMIQGSCNASAAEIKDFFA